MDKLHRRVADQADKLDREYDLLERMLDRGTTAESAPAHVLLVLQQAKRVRREAQDLVRALAAVRDNLS